MESTLIQKVILTARLKFAYYSHGLAALTPIESPGLGTVAVDQYWRLYYDLKFLQSIDIDQAAVLIAEHELQHLLRRHHKRSKNIGADARIWNIAADAEINDDISLSLDSMVTPSVIGADDGLMAEQYYSHLLEQTDNNHQCKCGSGAGGEKLPCELDGDDPDNPGINDIDSDQIRKRVAADIVAADKKKPGTIPNGIIMWAEEALERTKIDWRRVLQNKISLKAREIERGRRDYSWSRPSRKSMQLGIMTPGMLSYKPHIAIVVDTSGSMEGLGGSVLGNVHAICKSQSGKVDIISCDSEAHVTFKKQFIGGGGTDMRVGIKRAESMNADICIILTDGYTPWPERQPDLECIVVNFGDEKNNTPDWALEVTP